MAVLRLGRFRAGQVGTGEMLTSHATLGAAVDRRAARGERDKAQRRADVIGERLRERAVDRSRRAHQRVEALERSLGALAVDVEDAPAGLLGDRVGEAEQRLCLSVAGGAEDEDVAGQPVERDDVVSVAAREHAFAPDAPTEKRGRRDRGRWRRRRSLRLQPAVEDHDGGGRGRTWSRSRPTCSAISSSARFGPGAAKYQTAG